MGTGSPGSFHQIRSLSSGKGNSTSRSLITNLEAGTMEIMNEFKHDVELRPSSLVEEILLCNSSIITKWVE